MIQMTCPFCKREFPWDNGRLDYEIQNVKNEITKAQRRIAEIKEMPYLPDAKKEKRNLGLKIFQLNERSNQLRSLRKSADQQKHRQEYGIFKELVREKIGEDEFMKLIEKMEEEMKAYNISDMMRHEYTRSNSLKNVTSINKL